MCLPSSERRQVTVICPESVNLKAFPMRLKTIFWINYFVAGIVPPTCPCRPRLVVPSRLCRQHTLPLPFLSHCETNSPNQPYIFLNLSPETKQPSSRPQSWKNPTTN